MFPTNFNQLKPQRDDCMPSEKKCIRVCVSVCYATVFT